MPIEPRLGTCAQPHRASLRSADAANGAPALVTATRDGWRVVFSGSPGLPTAWYRRLARDAGVHLVGDEAAAEDVVEAAGGLLKLVAGPAPRARTRGS